MNVSSVESILAAAGRSGVFACAFVVGCVTDVEVGRRNEPIGGDSSVRVEADAQASATDCVPVRCKGPILQCGDCVDNDNDGQVDDQDPDCFGPCSDSESNLLGRARPCSNQACFFAPECGEGNDQDCSSLVPNGCDCHGCCEVGGRAIELGSIDAAGEATCNSETLLDPEACRSCVIDTGCFNRCDSCELCFGEETPNASCATDSGCPLPACSAEVSPCSSECGLSCPTGFACITGCCMDVR